MMGVSKKLLTPSIVEAVVKKVNDKRITNSKDLRKLRAILPDPVARANFLGEGGDLDTAMLRLAPQEKKPKGGLGDFKILAPTRDRYLKLIPEFSRTPESYAEAQKGLGSIFADLVKKVSQYVESWTTENLLDNPPKCTASNESSLVQQAIIDGRRILLTADAGPEALNEAADVATYFGVFGTPNVVQIPHHGSRRNVTPTLLNRWLGLPIPEGLSRGLAFCSVGKNKAEYPRKKVSNAFTRRGYEVIPTRGFSRGSNWGMPIKPDWVSVSGEPFSYEYEE
ncbi:hypothetical protein [Mesorhizobium sp.]|uniref:hypothetical protein n=1 Tax=Mesorhizobium sp. TaxID=1871066 RepID=UPI000FEA2CE3|nr:hypothetical protein [Mesorhizobium sp.]RWK43790.1 MAG: hypothetical protein EOR46_04910 [Mesorhizobium sp.]